MGVGERVVITEADTPRWMGGTVERVFVRQDGRVGKLLALPGDGWRVFLGLRTGFIQMAEPFRSADMARLELLRLMREMR